MAVLSDGNPNDTLALQAYETEILNVAAIEKIDLGAKLGLATEEITEDVLNVLIDHAANADARRRIGVSDVVVTPQMKRWHAVHTLEIVYRDAFNNQLNDRYKAKVAEYHELSRRARDNTFKFGIGTVLAPIPKAEIPALSTVAGPALGGTFYVAVSWVSANGQQGAPSDVTAFSTVAGTLLAVTAVHAPAIAAGYNVYVGTSADSLALQNAAPVPAGGEFVLSGGLVDGPPPGSGQAPDLYTVGGSTMRRG